MPCLILTGHPCVGKTTVAQWIKKRVEDRKQQSLEASDLVAGQEKQTASSESTWGIDNVVIVNEASACPGRTMEQCYANAASEKETRGAIKSEFDRQVAAATAKSTNSTTLVICDSMNYIKGFRYELHCISKASGQRHGILWILNSVNVANSWNEQRKNSENATTDVASGSYLSPSLMNELRQRYEPPDSRNRWDQPLYTLDMSIYLTTTHEKLEAESMRANADEILTSTNSITAPSSSDKTSTNTLDNNQDLAQDALQRSVYNMHALRDAFGSTTTDGATADSTSSTPVAPSVKKSTFKRAGFRRAAVPSSTTSTSTPTTSTVTASSKITPLTLANLQSVDKHNPAIDNQPSDIVTAPGRPAQHSSSSVHKVTTTDATSTSSTATTMEERVDEILESFLCKNVKALKEGVSTRVHVNANSDVLHNIDSVTQQVLHAISTTLSQQAQSSDNDGKLVLTRFNLTLARRPPPTVSELQRLRQQYLRWVATYPPSDTSEQGIAASFLSYVEAAQPE